MAFWLHDKERCAFGLGWEYRRRNLSLKDNPYPRSSFKWQAFRDGFMNYEEPKQAFYEETAPRR